MGTAAILAVYAILVERGLRLAIISRDSFSTLLASGFATVVGLQAFIVIGGVTKLIPLTGLTTPFLSYGGSSLVANWVIVGALIGMSHRARQPVPEQQAVAPSVSLFSSTQDTEVVPR